MDTGQDMERVTERRQRPRQAVDRVAFIQMADGNSGTILDVSETGLRFRTVAPITANGPVEFWYSMNLSDRVEAKGQVVWRDATRKEGGLCFTNGATTGEAKSTKKKKESTRTKARKNSGGYTVLGAIPEMQKEAVIDLTPELAAMETESTASLGAEKNEDVDGIVATGKVESSDEMTSKPEQRPKPQWKIELEEALARRAAGKVGAGAGIPREEPKENFAAVEEERAGMEERRTPTQGVSQPAVMPQPVAAAANPEARIPEATVAQPQVAQAAAPQAAAQATPQAAYATPPIPEELFARIAARESERFYMPTMERPARSSWSFLKGIFAGMVATAAIVAFGFYYLGLQQERASGNVFQRNEKSRTAEAAQDTPVDKDALQNAPSAAGALPQNSPATSDAAAGTVATPPAEDGRASDPRALAQKQIPQAGIDGTATPNSAAGAQSGATGLPQSQTTPRAAVSPTNPVDKVAQNGTLPAAAAKQKPYVKVPRTPGELWMDVAAGNTAAQIMLAQMYAVGDGVGKNCEQARVLLKAAAARGNAEAIKKYDDINETSCKQKIPD